MQSVGETVGNKGKEKQKTRRKYLLWRLYKIYLYIKTNRSTEHKNGNSQFRNYEEVNKHISKHLQFTDLKKPNKPKQDKYRYSETAES